MAIFWWKLKWESGNHAITAQILDTFFRARIQIGGHGRHGDHVVTNRKSKKGRKHKEYINRNR